MEELYQISFNGDWAGTEWTLANITYYDVDGNVTTQTSLATHYRLAEGVTEIAYRAFTSCNNLINIVLPDSVTIIRNDAFGSCENLESITFNNVSVIEPYCFIRCVKLNNVVLPNSLTTIGGSAFFRCNNITNIIIPDSVVNLGADAFGSCSNLETITISNSLNNLPDRCFMYCSSLNDVIIPNSIENLGTSCFQGCSSLSSISISSSVSEINSNLFLECDLLTTINAIPYTVEAANTLIDVLDINNSEVVDLVMPKEIIQPTLYSYGNIVRDFPNAQVLYHYGVKIWEREQPKSWQDYGEKGEYIQSVDGNGYIDSGIKSSLITNLKCGYFYIDNSSSYQWIYGAQISATNSSFANFISNSLGYVFRNGNVGNISFSRQLIDSLVDIEHSRTGIQMNDVLKSNVEATYSDLTFIINGTNINGNVNSYCTVKHKTYMLNDGNLAILIPLYLTKKPITDAAGRVHEIGSWVMYDTVTNTVPAHYGTFTGIVAESGDTITYGSNNDVVTYGTNNDTVIY